MTLTGTQGSNITLQSDTSGSPWLVHFNSAHDNTKITYASMKDSGCHSGSSAMTMGSTVTNSGNNDSACWRFLSFSGGGGGVESSATPDTPVGGGGQGSGGGGSEGGGNPDPIVPGGGHGGGGEGDSGYIYRVSHIAGLGTMQLQLFSFADFRNLWHF